MGENSRQSNGQLDSAQLLRRISHELLTPLTTIRLALQLGLSRLQRGDPIEPASLLRALSQVDETVRLISQFRDAAHLMGDDSVPTGQVLELGELVQRQLDQFALTHAKHRLEFRRTEAAVSVRADRGYLEQALSQILENACKFSPADSQIHISVACSEVDALVSITDHGVGIPTSMQARIFELFFRAPNAAESSARGLGIGLFIARGLISRCAGRLWVESELGGGSTFHVALPRYAPPEDAASS